MSDVMYERRVKEKKKKENIIEVSQKSMTPGYLDGNANSVTQA